MSQIVYLIGGIALVVSMILVTGMLFRKIDTNIRNILMALAPYSVFLAVRLKDNGSIELIYYLFAVFFLASLAYQIVETVRSKSGKKIKKVPERRQKRSILSIIGVNKKY